MTQQLPMKRGEQMRHGLPPWPDVSVIYWARSAEIAKLDPPTRRARLIAQKALGTRLYRMWSSQCRKSPIWRCALSFAAQASFVSITASLTRSGNRTICPRFRSSSRALVTLPSIHSLPIEFSDRTSSSLAPSLMKPSMSSSAVVSGKGGGRRRIAHRDARASNALACSASRHECGGRSPYPHTNC
jgi:hypothetical protein